MNPEPYSDEDLEQVAQSQQWAKRGYYYTPRRASHVIGCLLATIGKIKAGHTGDANKMVDAAAVAELVRAADNTLRADDEMFYEVQNYVELRNALTNPALAKYRSADHMGNATKMMTAPSTCHEPYSDEELAAEFANYVGDDRLYLYEVVRTRRLLATIKKLKADWDELSKAVAILVQEADRADMVCMDLVANAQKLTVESTITHAKFCCDVLTAALKNPAFAKYREYCIGDD